ncbi:MAG: hypothetical protein A2X34_06540 [Elusimicrobia bacterium GWC2_51_8]|nr:MAG: hypothetical protein A2X33_08915 [Elusimicrobia bacterium GWA2_51_34]OGR60270.1 MAG: hypothetical protein A2X34_06540 [Elusimicrobia bacterium GWC2_51_8]OGR86107.1 MAG: hypothetical protein A2021_01635 [Elusimicrobia bacterium GWF2_52_66]HAF96080.1 hydrogenase large subunit [Elusimicrobiota bacterium]HCE98688.1 hydrogenase large subunit [Elusimicrobiota bacterium]
MKIEDILKELSTREGITPVSMDWNAPEEVHLEVRPEDFKKTCLFAHQKTGAPVSALFAEDAVAAQNRFFIRCVFASRLESKWLIVSAGLPCDAPEFDSLANDIFSAALFEREIGEMFGIKRREAFDSRRLRLHPEVWPEGFYPLRKDFKPPEKYGDTGKNYAFRRVEGDGVFEVPVGPVHAGIIAPGHFRFSAAGEPVVNLEIQLGFTHKGVEKLFEGKTAEAALAFSELVDGEAAFAHSLAFADAVEKIRGIKVPEAHQCARAILLEIERLYNHAADVGGMATDVGFSFPAACASVIKENLLALNEKLTGSRYLKNFNRIGGVLKFPPSVWETIDSGLEAAEKDFLALKEMLYGSVSFMDRVEETGILPHKTAVELGVSGPAARASGVAADLRADFSPLYKSAGFKPAKQEKGDVLARLNVRVSEFKESVRLIKKLTGMIKTGSDVKISAGEPRSGCALGYAEGWRGPVLYWVRIGQNALVERCKITDPSFNNWEGLAQAVPGNIIPDFPLCNKSFNLSYPGNDL